MQQDPNAARPVIRRLVGIYNAHGTLRGELTYWVGARLGRAHCALCDITHGTFRERADWKACRAGAPVAFDTFHLDAAPTGALAAAEATAPVVLAETDDAWVLLLGPADLEACAASPEALMRAIEMEATRAGLTWS